MEETIDRDRVIFEKGTFDMGEFVRIVVFLFPRVLFGGAAGALLGFLLGQFTPKSYQSVALIEISSNPVQKVLGFSEANISEGTKSGPSLEVLTCEILAESEGVLSAVKAKFKDKGIEVTPTLSAISVPNTRLVKLRAHSPNFLEVVPAVNLWAETVIDVTSQQRVETFKKGEELLSGPYGELYKETDRLNSQIHMLSPQLNFKKAELKSRESLVLSQIEELTSLDPLIDRNAFTLPVLLEEIKKYPPLFPSDLNSNNTTGDSQFIGRSLGLETGTKVIGIVNYGANPLYVELQKKISDLRVSQETLVFRKKQLIKSIQKNKAEIRTLAQVLDTMALTLSHLERQYGPQKKGLDLIYGNMGESKLASSLPISNMRIASYATEPHKERNYFRYVLILFFVGSFVSFVWFYLKLLTLSPLHGSGQR